MQIGLFSFSTITAFLDQTLDIFSFQPRFRHRVGNFLKRLLNLTDCAETQWVSETDAGRYPVDIAYQIDQVERLEIGQNRDANFILTSET